jgi:hypothetical protein
MTDELKPLAVFDANGRYIRTDMVPEHQHTDGPQQWAMDHVPDVAPLRYRLATNSMGRRYFEVIAHADNAAAENNEASEIIRDVVEALVELKDYGVIKSTRLTRLRKYLAGTAAAPEIETGDDA